MKWLFSVMMPLFFISPEKGAETLVYVATSDELATVTGRYFTNNKEEALQAIGVNAGNREKLRQLTRQHISRFYA